MMDIIQSIHKLEATIEVITLHLLMTIMGITTDMYGTPDLLQQITSNCPKLHKTTFTFL